MGQGAPARASLAAPARGSSLPPPVSARSQGDIMGSREPSPLAGQTLGWVTGPCESARELKAGR